MTVPYPHKSLERVKQIPLYHDWGQQEISRRVAFRPHLTMGLALYRKKFEPPTGQTIPYWEQGMHILICFPIR